VTLTKDFYIGQTEVTQGQWKAVMGNNPSEFKGDDLPMEKVSWNDAMAFCEKLNSMGKAPSGWKFTLPSETQWEYAARGGNSSKGYKYSGSNNINDVAWCIESVPRILHSGDYRYKTQPVGLKKANELGLYDMNGNVYEWCLDENNDSSSRVIRGGGWGAPAKSCRFSARHLAKPQTQRYDLGFRLALVQIQ
jgi:formylglycine-generating enzyme required for sulfatase activity